MRTHISYWVRSNENTFMQMSPKDIAEMLAIGWELDIRIHQEYSSAYRDRLIYG